MKKLALVALILFPLMASSLAEARIRATATNLANRMERFSERLLEVPYVADPLGEGVNGRFDRDPRHRLDGFDCTTFVETVIATAKAHSRNAILPNMDRIRYKNGRVSFETRNHFTGADWIRNNVRNGILVDITQSIDRDSTYLAEAVIQRSDWYNLLKADRLSGIPEEEKESRLAELHALGQNFPDVVEKVPFLHKTKIDQNPEIINRIPHGSIINIVRPNWNLVEAIGTNMNVSHQGIAFHLNGVVYFRHASAGKKVMQEPLLDYVRKTLQSGTIQGINVLSVR
jgi:hypothetical protein